MKHLVTCALLASLAACAGRPDTLQTIPVPGHTIERGLAASWTLPLEHLRRAPATLPNLLALAELEDRTEAKAAAWRRAGDVRLERGELAAACEDWARAAALDASLGKAVRRRAEARAVLATTPAPRTFGSLTPLWAVTDTACDPLKGVALSDGALAFVGEKGLRLLDARTGAVLLDEPTAKSSGAVAFDEGCVAYEVGRRVVVRSRSGQRVLVLEPDRALGRPMPIDALLLRDELLVLVRARSPESPVEVSAFELPSGTLRWIAHVPLRREAHPTLLVSSAPGIAVLRTRTEVAVLSLGSGDTIRHVSQPQVDPAPCAFSPSRRQLVFLRREGQLTSRSPRSWTASLTITTHDAWTGEPLRAVRFQDPTDARGAWPRDAGAMPWSAGSILLREDEALLIEPRELRRLARSSDTLGPSVTLSTALDEPRRFFDTGDVLIIASPRGLEAFDTTD